MRLGLRDSIWRPWTGLACIAVGLATGCTSPLVRPQHPTLFAPPAAAGSRTPQPASSGIVAAGAVESASAPSIPAPAAAPFAGRPEFVESDLIAEVLVRNPTMVQMVAAAQAAAARYPQVTSLEDPRAGAFLGPASIGSRNVETAYRFEVSQAFPYPGKLALRGEAARNEAVAAGADADDTRLMLAEAARGAFADYYLATRAAEVNAEGLQLLREFRENAAARYRNNQGPQQDVLQADVAIARQRERAVGLDRAHRVARARINTLLNLPADADLPPPPKQLRALDPLPAAAQLRDAAVHTRPDVAAVRARVAADEAAVALALKEYCPDFEAMAAYDAWWQRPEKDLRPMVGVRLNIPIRTERRDAAVTEMRARLAQRQAELAKLVAQVGLQVQEAYEQVREAEQAIKLYEESALPAARENVRLAQAGYTVGRIPFLNLIEAQRNLVELRDRQFELLAEARRRRATLDRAVGAGLAPSPLVTAPKAEPTQPKPAPAPPAKPGGPSTPSTGGTGPGPSNR